MSNDIEFLKSKYGLKAIIKTAWKDSFLKSLLDKEIGELELNDGKGWKSENVDFLEFLPSLSSLIIIDLNLKSIDAIHHLNELKELKIITYCKKPINFHCFPKLIDCSFEWINGSESLFEVSNIEKLFINNYKEKSSKVFSKLINLTELTILNSSIEDLQGISILKNLKSLRLGNLKKVSSLQGIGELQQLEVLEVQRCKEVFTVFEIFDLSNLKCLLLLDLGEIASIKGIETLSNLEDFLFYGSTNVLDGDISPVFKLKNLVKISFQNRRHYTHKREDFGKLYA